MANILLKQEFCIIKKITGYIYYFKNRDITRSSSTQITHDSNKKIIIDLAKLTFISFIFGGISLTFCYASNLPPQVPKCLQSDECAKQASVHRVYGGAHTSKL